MSFGDRRLDRALDNWLTQTPEDYYGEDEMEKFGANLERGCNIEERREIDGEDCVDVTKEEPKNKLDKIKEPTANELMLEQGLCPYCKEKLDKVFVKHLKDCETFKKINEKEGEK